MIDEHAMSPSSEPAAAESSPQAPGSARDVEALVDGHQNALIRYAFRLVRSRETAQDIVQDAFVRYLRKPLDYGEPRQRAAWLYKVTHNLCIDRIKRESRRGEIHEKVDLQGVEKLPIAELLSAERWERLDGILASVSEDQRTVIVLFFQEGLAYREIVDVTGFSMSNVGMLLHRGLKKLRDVIEEEGLVDF